MHVLRDRHYITQLLLQVGRFADLSLSDANVGGYKDLLVQTNITKKSVAD